MTTSTDHPWIGIDAIIQGDDGKILLIKRSPSSKAYPDTWGLISGTVEWGEEIRETVIREVKEETNLDVKIDKFIGKYYDKKGRHPTKTMVCLPHVCSIIGGVLKAGDDAADAKWFSTDEIAKMELAFDHKQMLKDLGLIN